MKDRGGRDQRERSPKPLKGERLHPHSPRSGRNRARLRSRCSSGKRFARSLSMPRASLLVLFLVGDESGLQASFYSMLCRCDATNRLFRSWSPGPEVRCEFCREWHDLQEANDPLRYFLKVSPETLRDLRLFAGLDEAALSGGGGVPAPSPDADTPGEFRLPLE